MANNLIQIKRSLNTANPVSLANGELAFSANGNNLFIGSPNGSIIAIGGLKVPGVLTANQALVANATSGIDRIITANAIVTTVTANGTTGTAGQILTSNGTVAYWQSPASSSFTIAGDTGTDTFSTGQTLTFASANGLTTAVTDNQVGFSVDTGATLTVNTTGIHVNTANLVIATSQLSGDVTLGTQTSGNYVATITAGAGISGSSSSEGGAATIAVVANNGLVSNSTGVFVLANTGIVANTTGVFVNAAALSIATSQLTGDVALGTNTSGNYVATITAGNGISGSSSTEGGAATIAVVAGTGGGLVSNSSGVFIAATDGLVANATGLHVGAGNGISTTTDSVLVNGGSTLTVNSTGVHVNSALSITDLSLTGNLTVTGTLTTLDTVNLIVEDPLIKLANGNSAADLLDIGLYGLFGATGAKYTGMFRDATDGIYKLFTNLTEEPTTTVNTAGAGYTTATLQAFLSSGSLSSNTTKLTITANSTCNVAITANNLAWSGLAQNGIIYGGASGAFTNLSAGAGGTVLMVSTAGVPEFATLDGGSF
jgi:hypothetical protein